MLTSHMVVWSAERAFYALTTVQRMIMYSAAATTIVAVDATVAMYTTRRRSSMHCMRCACKCKCK